MKKVVVILLVLIIFVPIVHASQNIEYSYDGKISKIGNERIEYSYDGKITKIGNRKVEHGYDGKISKIDDSSKDINDAKSYELFETPSWVSFECDKDGNIPKHKYYMIDGKLVNP